MRILLLAGAAALTLTALPTALAAQQSVDEAADRAPASPTTAVTPPTEPARTADEANAQASPAPPITTVISDANPATPTVIARNNPGNLAPPPASAMNKVYPVCTRRLQDSCQNPGEGGAPGRSRALPYWPGEPASERTDVGG